MKIGFDILGGDFAPKNCLEGAILAVKELPADVKLVLIGEDADNIESQLHGHAEIIRANTLEEAVERGLGAARTGDAVLLAPACASFDMFKSFEERGKVFKDAVHELADRTRAGKAV